MYFHDFVVKFDGGYGEKGEKSRNVFGRKTPEHATAVPPRGRRWFSAVDYNLSTNAHIDTARIFYEISRAVNIKFGKLIRWSSELFLDTTRSGGIRPIHRGSVDRVR